MHPGVSDILTSAKAARAAFVSGTASAEEITRGVLANIGRDNPRLNAYREVLAETALSEARAADAARTAGREPGPLAGLCFGVKENIDTVPARASAGMRFLRERRPARDSWITARLRALGAAIVGTTISDPGAFGVRTAEVVHPLDPALSVGGSSGGSGAALAAGLCHGAIGTDTGGSIRIPAALCCIAGLKPGFGRSPMTGIWPLAPSLDHVGPMARNTEDLRLAAGVLLPHGPGGAPVERAIFDPDWIVQCDGEVQRAFAATLARLERAGVSLAECRLPALDRVAGVHATVLCVEAAAFYGSFVAPEAELPHEGQSSIAFATTVGMPAYLAACRERQQMRAEVDSLFGTGSVIISPTTAIARAAKADKKLPVAGEMRDFTYGLVRLTCLFDHTGHPAAALPAEGGSLQVVAAKDHEHRTLALPLDAGDTGDARD